MTEHITWVVLPNGQRVDNDNVYLRFSVFPNIRLSGGSKLEDFSRLSNWHQHTPPQEAVLEFSIFGDKWPVEANLISTLSPNLEGLWNKIFPGSTPVAPFDFKDHAAKKIHSYSVNSLQSFILEEYAKLGLQSPDEPVATWELVPIMESLSDYEITDRVFQRKYVWPIQPEKDPSGADITAPSDGAKPSFKAFGKHMDEITKQHKWKAYANTLAYLPVDSSELDDPDKKGINYQFAHLEHFYAPGEAPSGPYTPSDLLDTDFDFHQRLTALGEYPKLMRALGLILDYELDIPLANIDLPYGDEYNAVSFATPGSDWSDQFPKTYFQLDPFRPRESKDGDLFKGYLKVGPNEGYFTLSQVDTEGSALKLKKEANNLVQRMLLQRDVSQNEGLPALRTAGITLARNDLKNSLSDRFARNKDIDGDITGSGPSVPYSAADLLSGYRMDIYDEDSGNWYSLYRRNGQYSVKDSIKDDQLEPYLEKEHLEDEGYSQLGVSQRTDLPTADLYAAEGQFVWDGWSLGVARPSKPTKGEQTVESDDEFVTSEFSVVKNSLPKLRFGKSYRVRIRAVDLAGNSLADWKADSIKPKTTEAAVDYKRYEAVESPVILRADYFKDGESLESPTVRSDGQGGTSFAYEDTWWKTEMKYKHEVDLQKDEKDHSSSIRLFLPPDVDYSMVEKHGMYDDDLAGAYQKILQQLDPNVKPEDDTNGIYQYHPNTLVEKEPDGLQLKMYDPESSITPKYFPDPAAEGIAFWMGSPKEILIKCSFYPEGQEWNQPKAVTLKLVEGDTFGASLKDSVITITLPRGEQRQLYYSSYVSADTLEQKLAFWPLLVDQLKKGKTPLDPEVQQRIDNWRNYFFKQGPKECKNWNEDQLKTLALDGGLWLLTPPRPLLITHAVQQPMETPEVESLIPFSAPSQSHVKLEGTFDVHGHSTGNIEVLAKWHEYEDEKPDIRVNSLEDLFQQKEELVEDRIIPYDTETYLPKLPQAIKHRFNTSKHRKIEYKLRGITRYQEYFDTLRKNVRRPFPTTATSTMPYTVHTKNAVRPVAPEITYTIPLLPWERKQQSRPAGSSSFEIVEHKRIGGALRVYFKRPWFLSGEGELLGVVCLNPEFAMERLFFDDLEIQTATKEEGILLKATRWAKDPINYQIYKLDRYPTVRDFNRFEAKKTGLVLEGETAGAYDVVGYPVHYDPDRNLLYSDLYIDIPEGHYFPFFRLCFARFQPESLNKEDLNIYGLPVQRDYHISDIIPAEFIQVLPDRTCHFLMNPKQKNLLAIHLQGPVPFTDEGGHGVRVRNYATLQVEEKVGTGENARYLLDPTETRVFSFFPPGTGSVDKLESLLKNPALKDFFFHHPVGSGEFHLLQPYDPVTQKLGSPLIELSKKYKTRPYRLVLTEWEVRQVDPKEQSGFTGTTGASARAMAMPQNYYGSRVVFADSLEVEGEAGEFPGRICWKEIGKSTTHAQPSILPWGVKNAVAMAPDNSAYLNWNPYQFGKWTGWSLAQAVKKWPEESKALAAVAQHHHKIEFIGRLNPGYTTDKIWMYEINGQLTNGVWSEVPFNMDPISDPAAFSCCPDRLDVFALKSNGAVRHIWRKDNDWHLPVTIKGNIFAEGTVFSAAGLLKEEQTGTKLYAVIAAIDDTGTAWMSVGTGLKDDPTSWKGWSNVGKGFTPSSTIHVAQFDDAIYAFARKEDGRLGYAKWAVEDGIFTLIQRWKLVGKGVKSITIPADERIQTVVIPQSIGYQAFDLIVRDESLQLYRSRWQGEQWSNWEILHPGPHDAPVSATATYEEVHLIYQDKKAGVIKHASYLAPLES